MRFFICKVCGNLTTLVEEKGGQLACCGQNMTELIPGEVEAAVEKHIPVISVDGKQVTVTVGEVEHPMLPEHYIKWVALETKEGTQLKYLEPGQKPKAVFALSESDEVIAAYAYCNLHGLWKKMM